MTSRLTALVPFAMSLVSRLLLLLAAGFTTIGCTQTAMLPAQQLEEGQTVSAFTIDEPGILYLPRGTR